MACSLIVGDQGGEVAMLYTAGAAARNNIAAQRVRARLAGRHAVQQGGRPPGWHGAGATGRLGPSSTPTRGYEMLYCYCGGGRGLNLVGSRPGL